jgi:tRNA-specific 2-thiouridylase
MSTRVFVALSGGVDSSTAAALLLENGYDCSAVFLLTCDHAEDARGHAARVAAQLKIPFHVLDVRSSFAEIIRYFCDEYRAARTPNPCVLCNRRIKFGLLWEFARDNGADLLATGHYARLLRDGGRPALCAAADLAKDQSYALAMVERDMLERIIFPMGELSKQQVRAIAASLGLASASRPESQEICFVPDNDYAGLLERTCPDLARPGKIVDSAGRLLGEHSGIHRFTIGQRRGVRVAMGKPWYVSRLDAAANTVTLGPRQDVLKRNLTAAGVNWLIDVPSAPFRARVKIRYNSAPADATISGGGDYLRVEFDRPVWAVTPGQLAVAYVERQGILRVAAAGRITDMPSPH